MSLLTFLCLTSLLALSLADPVPASESTSDVQKPPDDSPDQIKYEIEAILDKIDDILDTYLSEILSELASDDQEYIMQTTKENMKSSLNYARYMFDDASGANEKLILSQGAVLLTFMGSDFDDEYLEHIPVGSFKGAVPDSAAP